MSKIVQFCLYIFIFATIASGQGAIVANEIHSHAEKNTHSHNDHSFLTNEGTEVTQSTSEDSKSPFHQHNFIKVVTLEYLETTPFEYKMLCLFTKETDFYFGHLDFRLISLTNNLRPPIIS